ncbi:ATP-grasp domain-containing protein [Streptomyces gobiensis]|uniref:ATP-grasp domain-containing protein n=1 Tax=Streptomyces gobiensis TaxID=2875706 RepID=UPI001E383D34|nr:ATP-grasp domain-containing protein [Streptomyces gobiensis]UGY91985.1 ATP-grasp domain-containing protein [Streptomyces gobiensis]
MANEVTTAEPVLLVIGIGSQKDRDSRPYREYLLSAAAQRFPVWLFDSDEPSWQREYIVGATALDCYDGQTLADGARELAASRPVIGMFCPDEGILLSAAYAAEALGLDGLSVESARACRDKKISRALLTEAGIAQPQFRTVRSTEEALRAAEELQYPVVLKPRTLGSSSGVVMANGPADMAAAFAATSSAAYPGVYVPDDYVIEQYLDGPEVSIDGAVFDGEYTPMFIGRKQVAGAPYFVETGHLVSADDPLLDDPRIMTMLADAHKALGITHGTTHSEVKLTSRGPVIVEVNGRLGGDLIPYLGKLATGIDPGRVAVDVLTGVKPDFSSDRARTLGIRFFAPTVDCRVREITIGDTAGMRGIVQATAMVQPGTELRCPPAEYVSRYAFVIAEGRDEEECRTRLAEAEQLASLDYEPLEERDDHG